MRVIFQYSTVLANPALTSLQTAKNFNADFLITFFVHPGTALYIGYNSNLQNLDPRLLDLTRIIPNQALSGVVEGVWR